MTRGGDRLDRRFERLGEPPEGPARSIRTRLLVAFALTGVVVVGAALAGLLATRASAGGVREVASRTLPVERANTQLREVVSTSAASLRGYLITGDASLLTSFRTSWAGYAPALARAQAGCADEPGVCAALQQQDAQVQDWYRTWAQPLVSGALTRRAATQRYPASRALLNQFVAANDRASTTLDHAIDDRLSEASGRRRLGISLLTASTALAALCLGGLAWLTVRQVVPPLTALRDVLRRLAAGDLDARVEVAGPAETRAVALSLNRLAEQSLRLRDAEYQRAEVRAITRDLDRRMRQHLHPDAVADEAVSGVGGLVGADRVHVRFVENGRMGPVAAQWTTRSLPRLPDDPPGPTDPLESAGAVADRGHQSVVVDDVGKYLQGGSSTGAKVSAARTYAGVGSMVVAPVMVGLERIGVLVCARSTEHPRFDTAAAGLVETVAGDLARAVHHARLFEQQSTVVGQLRELDRTKSDFLSTISHELRTPLTSIAGYVEMMRDGDAGELQPMQDNMLEIVARNTQRLRDLIEDVLMISRVESGAVRSERMPVALGGVVDHVVTALRPQADAAGVRIDVYPVPDDALLLGDPGQIDRLLLNLVGNAVKFTPRRGRVTVSVEVSGDDLLLRVQDTGIGIPADEIDQLFTRFYRASNATHRQIPGTGLGLAIIAGIAAAHDGRVEVDSVEGRGTTFTVTLPRWDVDAPGQSAGALRV